VKDQTHQYCLCWWNRLD